MLIAATTDSEPPIIALRFIPASSVTLPPSRVLRPPAAIRFGRLGSRLSAQQTRRRSDEITLQRALPPRTEGFPYLWRHRAGVVKSVSSGRSVVVDVAALTDATVSPPSEKLVDDTLVKPAAGEGGESADGEVADDGTELLVAEDAARAPGLVGAHDLEEHRCARGIGKPFLQSSPSRRARPAAPARQRQERSSVADRARRRRSPA